MFAIVEAAAKPPPLLSLPFPLSTFPFFSLGFDFVTLLDADGAVKVGFVALGFAFDLVTFEEEDVEEGRGGLKGFGGMVDGW